MKYALCVLSHGDSQRMAKSAIHNFSRYVQPAPTEIIHHHDDASEGFCGATKALWTKAALTETEFVFWLEHDFRFMRRANLLPLARLLRDEQQLAQVAFLRYPVNDEEREAGGVYQMHPASDYEPGRHQSDRWLEHRINFTTNPSLMRRQVLVDNPWPKYKSQCEGRFSADFLARGYRFAYWGTGSPWVHHVGPMRTGHSY